MSAKCSFLPLNFSFPIYEIQFFVSQNQNQCIIAFANLEGHGKYNELIKTQSNYMHMTRCAGKRVRRSHSWVWLYFWLDQKNWREFLNQSCSVAGAKPITFRHSNENHSKWHPISFNYLTSATEQWDYKNADMLGYSGRGFTGHGQVHVGHQNPSFLIFPLHTALDCMEVSFATI